MVGIQLVGAIAIAIFPTIQNSDHWKMALKKSGFQMIPDFEESVFGSLLYQPNSKVE